MKNSPLFLSHRNLTSGLSSPRSLTGVGSGSDIMPLLVTEKVAAELLGISERALFTLRKTGEIKSVLIPGSRSVRYSVETIREFIKTCEARSVAGQTSNSTETPNAGG